MGPHDAAIAATVTALEMMLGNRVLCIVAIEPDGMPYIVCPEHRKFEVMSVLAHVDFADELMSMQQEQDSRN